MAWGRGKSICNQQLIFEQQPVDILAAKVLAEKTTETVLLEFSTRTVLPGLSRTLVTKTLKLVTCGGMTSQIHHGNPDAVRHATWSKRFLRSFSSRV